HQSRALPTLPEANMVESSCLDLARVGGGPRVCWNSADFLGLPYRRHVPASQSDGFVGAQRHPGLSACFDPFRRLYEQLSERATGGGRLCPGDYPPAWISAA